MKTKCIILFLITLTLVGCRNEDPNRPQVVFTKPTVFTENDYGIPKPEETNEPVAPHKDEVLAKRDEVLEGMTEEEITRMKTFIKDNNMKFEREIMWNNILVELSDSENMNWDLLSIAGEVQTGWAYDQETLKLKKTTELSEDEFNEQYGEKVTTYNYNTAADYIQVMEELKESTNSEALKKDFEAMQENLKNAESTHDVSYIEELYKFFHDMDYYLLRYGLEDVAIYVEDLSTISKYYGVLNVYK